MKKPVDSNTVEPPKPLFRAIFPISQFDNQNDRCYNGNMKRVVYYVIHCTSEENQAGIFHYSNPLKSLSTARRVGAKYREKLGNGEGHVAIEKHHENFERGSWHIDHEAGGSEHVDYL